MVVYSLDTNEIFLSRHDTNTVRVFRMNAVNSAIAKVSDFKFIDSVGTNLKYDGLEIFGVVIKGSALKKLAETLCNSHLIVNREGFCYVNTKGIVEQSFGVELYRLNDLFNWFDYGVKASITTVWNRCDICKGGALINYVEQNKSFQECRNDLNKKDMKIVQLKQQLAEFKDAEKQLPENEEKLKKVNTSELDRLMSKVAALESELEQFSAQAEEKSCKSELDLSKAKAENLQAELNQCRAEAELKSTKWELELSNMKVAILQAELKQCHAEAELKSMESELEVSNTKVAALQAELNHGHTQLDAAISNEDNLGRTCSTLVHHKLEGFCQKRRAAALLIIMLVATLGMLCMFSFCSFQNQCSVVL